MKLDTNRIVRTLIQAASGAGVSLLTAVTNNFSKEAIITAVVSFATTVVCAVLMNINKQAEEQSEKENNNGNH